MIKVLASGGLGDALMSYCKMKSPRCPFDIDDVEITHVEVPTTLLSAINQFYVSQDLVVDVKNIPNWDYYHDVLKHKFDYVLGSTWDGNRDKDDTGFTTWEIEPFPKFKTPDIEQRKHKILVAVGAGRRANRKFRVADVYGFDSKHANHDYDIAYTGIVCDSSYYNGLRKSNFVNKLSSVVDLIGMILKADIVISHAGFVTYLAGAARKKVFCVSEGTSSDIRTHPEWDVTYIQTLEDIKL